jgi:hypothetical protein
LENVKLARVVRYFMCDVCEDCTAPELLMASQNLESRALESGGQGWAVNPPPFHACRGGSLPTLHTSRRIMTLHTEFRDLITFF